MRPLPQAPSHSMRLAWCASAAVLFAIGSDDAVAAPIILVVTGIGFPLIAWALTRREAPPAVPVPRPGLELGVVLVFLALYAVALHRLWPERLSRRLRARAGWRRCC